MVMKEIRTNEWTSVWERKPPVGREVLVAFAGGRNKMTLAWDGRYWYEPGTGIRQSYTPGHRPTMWYMFEKCPEDYGR